MKGQGRGPYREQLKRRGPIKWKGRGPKLPLSLSRLKGGGPMRWTNNRYSHHLIAKKRKTNLLLSLARVRPIIELSIILESGKILIDLAKILLDSRTTLN